MPLPKGVATLKAKGTGNETRPDNVFCSRDFLDHFISCNAYPTRVPGTTDHYPIISEIDLVMPVKEVEEQWNWRGADWPEWEEELSGELEALGEVDGYASLEEVMEALGKLDAVVWKCVRKHVPIAKISPHSKRWWKVEFTERDRLATKSYRQRDVPESPVHEEYR
ncbi:hypothetical protein DFH07DRAFT_763334, partial [Mycena maculata]